MQIKNGLTFVLLALLVILGSDDKLSAQSEWQQQGSHTGVEIRAIASDGSRISNMGYNRLGVLCDSLQLALNLPAREVLPVEIQGGKSYKRLDEIALRLTLTEICNALGIEANLPLQFTPSNLDVLLFSIIGPPSMTISAAEITDGSASSDGALSLTFTSSIITSDFGAEDITLTNGTLSDFTGSGKTYTATFTPDGDGVCTILVAVGTFSGDNGMSNVVEFDFTWTHDATPPTVTITAQEVTDETASSDATLSLTFAISEITTNFSEDDITVSNGFLSLFSGSGMTYSATFTPNGTGACTINVAEEAFTDWVGNMNTAADEFNWTHAFAPTVGTDEASLVMGKQATLSATFTDGGSAVIQTGFYYSTDALLTSPLHIPATGLSSPFAASLTGLTGSTQYWAVGYATNAVAQSFGDTITFTTRPTMTITAGPIADGTSSSDATLSLTFTASGSTTDFTEEDIMVTNGTISSFAGSGTTYSATFTPTGFNPCTINVAEGSFTDLAGNGNMAADEFNWTRSSRPTLDTQAASLITKSSALLTGSYTLYGTAAPTIIKFYWANNPAFTNQQTVSITQQTSNTFSATLYSLWAETQYWAYAYAWTSTGPIYGDTITFTTSAAPTCSVPNVTYDGHTYPTVYIGNRCWFAENLRNDNYADGTPIPGGLSNSTWTTTTAGAQTVYDEGGPTAAANLDAYGRLYNWYAVIDPAGLCPTDWHVPTDEEWTALAVAAAGGNTSAGIKLKATSPDWDGTNTSGFSAVPGGNRLPDGASGYYGGGTVGNYWTSTPSGSNIWYRSMSTGSNAVSRSNNLKRNGFSVRCVQYPTTTPIVDTEAASSITNSTATLNASFSDGQTPVTETAFKYSTDALLTNPTIVAGNGTTSPFTGAITGLTADTQYWAVGYATNALGTSYGDTITFTTTSSEPAVFTNCGDPIGYDGYDYTTIQIGSQCWFAENLWNDNYNNGAPIPGNLDDSEWSNTASGAYAVYEEGGANETTNLTTYGRLYNWAAVHSAAGLCPSGWHIPTDTEWTTLEESLGGSVAGNAMKATSPTWDGTNTSGYSGLPGGLRGDDGNFSNQGTSGYWWSSSSNGTNAWHRSLSTGNSAAISDASNLRSGYSVRCLLGAPPAPTVNTNPASAVTENSATLNGTFTDGGNAVTATGFKYGTDALLTNPTMVSGSGTTSPFAATLTGLAAATDYWVVGFATNAGGTSYGDTIGFTTLLEPAVFNNCGDEIGYDGYNYTTVQIGSQCWFAENLRNDNYANESPIQGGLDNSTWSSATSGAYTVYDEGGANEAANLAAYGRLYNGYAVSSAAGLCPSGWHVPTDWEWNTLENTLGNSLAGDAMKAAAPTWDGSNSSEFNAMPSGYRDFGNGDFDTEGLSGVWWTSSSSGTSAWHRSLSSGFSGVNRASSDTRNGYSIRCVLGPMPAVPTVDTKAASLITATGATLNATFSDGNVTVTATGFKFAANGLLIDPIDVASSGSSSPFTAELTGLSSATQYWAVGYATNALGTSYGDTITFSTLEGAPSVNTQAASLVTETEATLNATFTDGGNDVTATGFKYGLDANLTNPTDVASYVFNPFSASLTGLTPATQYWAVGYATNELGTSYGDTIAFTTLAMPSCSVPSVTYDGYSYPTVLIGTQCWFAENLRSDNYADGTEIPGGLYNALWTSASSGAQAVYGQGTGDEAANLLTYGRLYNWYAVNHAAGLCPTGWHVPTDAEWTTLETTLGGSEIAGDALKAPSPAWDGTNPNGFSALPGGYRYDFNGNFFDLGDDGYWWTSSSNEANAWLRILSSESSMIDRFEGDPRSGYSIRCVQAAVLD